MRINSIQDLIINILSGLGGKSIRKSKLSTKIIAQLQWDIRRTNRALFEKKVYKALIPLINRKIVKEFKYKKEYDEICVRLKLYANYRRKLDFFGSKSHEKIQWTEDSSIAKNKNLDEDVYAINYKSDLPDLPDEVFHYQDENGNDSEEVIVDPEDSPDKDYLLDIFLGEAEKKTDIPKELDHESKQHKNYLKNLEDFFVTYERIDTKLSFSELKLKVSTDSGGIVVSISLYAAKREIVVKSYIPYLSEAAFDILRLFSHIDFIGSLCVEERQNQLFYSVRISIDISKFAESETIGIIEQIIHESIKIEEIIDRHL
ncbi:hypothetical protein ACFLRM_03745 [Acidobacteriota bacterium]